jgi:hypothetical protein
MKYDVWVEVAGVEGYKYIRPLTTKLFESHAEAKQAIEDEIAKWPRWSEQRKASFRSHCKIKGLEALDQGIKKKLFPTQRFTTQISSRELDTIIAALRWWERSRGAAIEKEPMLLDIAEEHGAPLTDAEIDTLIERVN